MIYLFGTGSFKGETKSVKVGYTDNKEKRIKAYGMHNPKGEFLAWRPGDETLELKLHLRLQDWKEEFLEEWFVYDPEVERIFGQSEDEINRWLWENRLDVFYKPGHKGGKKVEKIKKEIESIFNPKRIENENSESI